MLEIAGVEIEFETEKSNFNGMEFAFGPKILMDPQFAITFLQLKDKFKGKNKISKDATLILSESATKFENLEINKGTLICKNGAKCPAPPILFEVCDEGDNEIFCIRGFKPKSLI
jgi:hypothetical protein